MQRENSESDNDSEATSDLLTEDVENDQHIGRHDDDDGEELSGSIYQKGGSFMKQMTDSQLRRAKTSNLGQ